MNNLIFKWKQWYWNCAFFSNIGATLFLSLFAIFLSKQKIYPERIESLIFLSVSAPLLITLFFIYWWKTNKETYLCASIIKPERYKYFQIGFFSSFIMFSIYVIFWLLSWKTGQKGWIYGAIALVVIFGFISIIFLTIYEFSISFDIFYNKNKSEIVHEFLAKNMKKISEREKTNIKSDKS